ncbi:uncharacterized protein [Procambarus clarkii]|uniref:uncharacterized protein n=1 Tax=Procambarus clarkii TaxID=6728 RepID=UPI003743DC70
MQYELANVQSYNKTVCPACHTNPFAIHIDGNKKLFRYEKVGRGLRESFYSESVFAADNDVTNHLNHIESLKTKVLYGGRWQHGSGLTTGEETEQIFSYMSRYNSTTKNMLKTEREEELSESSFFWNQRKHDSLARVLASRFCKAKEAAELIRKELADLSLDEKQLLIWIAELTNLAQSLNKRSVSQNDVQKGIELVCDSIRTKKSHISSVAVSSKMRSRYRAKIEADKKKLRELIAVYNEDNTEKLSVDIAEEGNFPWYNDTPQPTDNVTLQEKRNAAEKLHMYNRTMEEQNVIQLEMKSYLDFYRKKLEEITQRLDDVQNKSALPSWIIEVSIRYQY